MSNSSNSFMTSLDKDINVEHLSENNKKTSYDDSHVGKDVCNADVNTGEDKERELPDGGWGWFVVLGCFVVHFILGGLERSGGVIYLQLLSRFSHSAIVTAWVVNLPTTLRLLLGPLASALCIRFSCRVVVFVGAGFYLIGMFTSSFVPDIPYMFVTYGILVGVGRALVYTPSIVAVGHYFDKKRGLAIGLSTSGVGLGSFACPPVIELMFNYYGYFWTLMILAAFTSNHFVCACFYRPLAIKRKLGENIRGRTHSGEIITDAGARKHLLSDVPVDIMGSGLSSPKSTQQSLSTDMEHKNILDRNKYFFLKKNLSNQRIVSQSRYDKNKTPLINISILKDFAFCALCIQLFLFSLSVNMTSLFLPALAQQKGMSNLEGAYLVSISGICNAISIVIVSFVLDLKRIKPYRLYLYNMVMFIAAAVSVLMPSLNNLWTFAVISGLFGMLGGAYMAQKPVVAVDVLGEENMSSAFGFLVFAQGLSTVVGPTVGGLFKDLLGDYDHAFYFGSLGIVTGGVVMAAANVWIYKKRKKDLKHRPKSFENI